MCKQEEVLRNFVVIFCLFVVVVIVALRFWSYDVQIFKTGFQITSTLTKLY